MIGETPSTYHVVSHSPAIVWVLPVQIDSRLDAQPFLPELLGIDQLLAERSDSVAMGIRIQKQRGLTGGATPLGANYPREGVRFIRTENVTPNWIDLSNVVYISSEDHAALRRSALEAGDVLLTITGALFGQSATVYPECLPANISQHSVRMAFVAAVNPRYVATYLNSKYGQAQIQKHKVGATRSALDYESVRALRLPLPPNVVQDYIGAKVRLAERCRLRARELRTEAQRCLDAGVGIDVSAVEQAAEGKRFRILSMKPEAVLINTRLVSSRLDSGAYSPVRLALLDALGDARCEFRAIDLVADDVTAERKRSTRAKSGATYFISILHLNNKGVVDLEQAKAHDPVSPGILCTKDDVLFSGINPRQNRVAVWLGAETSLCSAEFAIYRAKSGFSPFYLSFVWRSQYCLNQLEALTRGTSSSRRRLQEEDFAELLVPVLPSEDRASIAHNEENAVALDTKASQLVREAKADVEALIEGRLDVDGILTGRVKPPTWDEIGV